MSIDEYRGSPAPDTPDTQNVAELNWTADRRDGSLVKLHY